MEDFFHTALKYPPRKKSKGRRKSKGLKEDKGRYVKSLPMDEKFRRIALDATLKKAAFHISQDNSFNITKEDLMAKAYSAQGGASILFVVDASGSMGVEELMAKTKSLVIALLKDAYQKRERVGMMVFRGVRAEMVLPFTRSVHLAKSRLKEIKTGGKTPLSLALKKSITELAAEKKRHNKNDIILFCFTDGRANISLAGNDPFEEALSYARTIRAMKIKAFVVDTDPTWISYPYAKDAAKEMGAKYFKLADVAEGNIRDLIYRDL